MNGFNLYFSFWKSLSFEEWIGSIWFHCRQCHPNDWSWCWFLLNKWMQPLLYDHKMCINRNEWMNEWVNESINKPKFQRDEKLFNVQTDLHTLHVKCGSKPPICTNVFGLKDLAILYMWYDFISWLVSVCVERNEMKYRNIFGNC